MKFKISVVIIAILLSLITFFYLVYLNSKPTYPKERLIKSLIALCKKEYNIDVNAKLIGKTLGVQVYIDKIFNPEDGSLNKEGQRTMVQFDICLRRVCASTDADIEFIYTSFVCMTMGVELNRLQNFQDYLKVVSSTISQGDFKRRMISMGGVSPKIAGEKVINEMFVDIEQGQDVNSLFEKHFQEGSRKNIPAFFFDLLLERQGKGKMSYEVVRVKSIPLSATEELFHCEVKETYVRHVDFWRKDFSYPENFLNEYLIVIEVKKLTDCKVKLIYPLYEKGGRIKKAFPPQYKRYQNIYAWDEKDFFMETNILPQFLAQQMALRLKLGFKEKMDLKLKEAEKSKEFPVEIEGSLSRINSEIIELTFSRKVDISELSNQTIKEFSLQIFKEVCKKYQFFNFTKVRLIDLDTDSEIAVISVNKDMFKRGNIFQEAFGLTD